MRKILTMLIISALIMVYANQYVWAQQTPVKAQIQTKTISVVLDGKPIAFDVTPKVIDNRTMVPLRALFEALGASVEWNNKTNTAIATKEGVIIKLQINEKVAYKNGQPINLEVAAKIVGTRTLVPLRFVSEALGATVDWDDTTQTANITSPQALPPPSSNNQQSIVKIEDSKCFAFCGNSVLNSYVIREALPSQVKDFTRISVYCFDKSTAAADIETCLKGLDKSKYYTNPYNSAGFSSSVAGGIDNYTIILFLFDSEDNPLGYHVIDPEEVDTREDILINLVISFENPVHKDRVTALDFNVTRKIKGNIDPEYTYHGGTSDYKKVNDGIISAELKYLLKERSDITYEITPKDSSMVIKEVKEIQSHW